MSSGRGGQPVFWNHEQSRSILDIFYRTLCRVDLKYLVELLEHFLCLLDGNEFLGLFRQLGGQLDAGLVTLNIASILNQHLHDNGQKG